VTEAPVAQPDAARATHPYRAFLLRIGLGAAIVGFLLWHYDARPALRALAREKIAFFVATIALYLAGQVMSAYRWKLLASVLNLRGPFSEYFRYYFVGVFTNLFVPGLVGGDAARAIYLGRRHHKMTEAIASAVADRGYGLLALFWFAALIARFLNRGVLASSVITPTIAVGAITFAGYLASPLIARGIHMAPRPIRRALGIIAPYLHRPLSVVPAIALSIVLQASLAFCQYLLALGLGLNLSVTVFLLVVPIANVFASLPLTLNGLGIRETAYLILFGMAGVSRDDAIALGLLWFAATMMGGLFGAIAFVSTEVPTTPFGPGNLGTESPLDG
jgi:glycosyltransferase 2 family protein